MVEFQTEGANTNLTATTACSGLNSVALKIPPWEQPNSLGTCEVFPLRRHIQKPSKRLVYACCWWSILHQHDYACNLGRPCLQYYVCVTFVTTWALMGLQIELSRYSKGPQHVWGNEQLKKLRNATNKWIALAFSFQLQFWKCGWVGFGISVESAESNVSFTGLIWIFIQTNVDRFWNSMFYHVLPCLCVYSWAWRNIGRHLLPQRTCGPCSVL